MTQRNANRIMTNNFEYNRDTAWGKYRYTVKSYPPDTGAGPWERWIVRCPRGRENDEFLTHDGRIASKWEKFVLIL